MASFTDRIAEFNPYVQQLPIEAMVQVGTHKQALYDQGYQKIQANIDNIAGMDVIRDVDKAYLQSKLGELKGKLRGVAAGDFSNYQLVNNVGGMISQIGKDKYIQNAVGSAAKYRKGVADMETARKEGKSSPSNEYVFNRQAQEWLNNTDINSSFNGAYKPYSNWKKNGLDVLKALTKDETITDDAFTVDSRGNLVIADTTVRKKLAGISPEKIQQALMVGLTPADFEQMGIDGIYNYSNLSDEQFTKGIQQSNSSTLNFYRDQKKTLENAKSSTTSVIEKRNLDEQIAALNKTIIDVSSQYNDILASLQQGQSDNARAQYFTRNSIDGFAKAFSYTETSQTYQGKTPQEMQMWREDKAQDWKKFLLKYEQDERGLKLKERDTKAKEKEMIGYGGLPVGIKQEDIPKYTLNKVVEETKQGALTIQALDNNFAKQQGKDDQWLNQQKEAWEKSPSSVSPIVAEHLALTENLRRSTMSDIVMITDIEKQAIEQFGDIYQNIPKDAPTLRYKSGNTEYNYAPKDFVDFNQELQKYISVRVSGGTGGASVSSRFDVDKGKQELSPKFYNLLNILQKGPSNEAEKTLVKHINEYNKTINIPYKETLKKISDFTEDEVSKRISINQGVSYGLPTGSAEQKSTIATTLTQFAALADSQDGKLPNSPDFDSDIARKLATEDAKYALTVVEGTERQPTMYEMNVSGKSGQVSFKITPEQKDAILGQAYNSSPKMQAIAPYLEQMRKMGGYSTAFTSGPSTQENSFLTKVDFPAVKTYGVKANIVTLMPNSNRYTIKLSLFDPVQKIWHNDIDFPRTGMIPAESIADALNMLNDASIYELINEAPATANDLKTVENASKKPL